MESSEYVRLFSFALIDFKRKSLENEFGCGKDGGKEKKVLTCNDERKINMKYIYIYNNNNNKINNVKCYYWKIYVHTPPYL